MAAKIGVIGGVEEDENPPQTLRVIQGNLKNSQRVHEVTFSSLGLHF